MSEPEKHPIVKLIISKLEEYGFDNQECNDEGEDYESNEAQLESPFSDDKYAFVMDGTDLEVYGGIDFQRIGVYDISNPNDFDLDKIITSILKEQVILYRVDEEYIEGRKKHFEDFIQGMRKILKAVRG